MADKIVPGKDTTEYAVQKSSKLWMVVGVVLGFLLEIGGGVMSSLDMQGTTLIIVGAVLQGLSLMQNTLVNLGYIKSRTDVKDAAVKVDGK